MLRRVYLRALWGSALPANNSRGSPLEAMHGTVNPAHYLRETPAAANTIKERLIPELLTADFASGKGYTLRSIFALNSPRILPADESRSFENTIFKSLIPWRQPSDWLAN